MRWFLWRCPRQVLVKTLFNPTRFISLLSPLILQIKSFEGAPEWEFPSQQQDPGHKDKAGLSEALAYFSKPIIA